MRVLGNLLRGVVLLFTFGIFGIAVAGAISDRKAREGQPKLPTRIGERKVEPSFWEDVQSNAADIWISIYAEYLPGLLPDAVIEGRKEQSSLEALGSRTRNTSDGLTPLGSLRTDF